MQLILYFVLVALILGSAYGLAGESPLCKTWNDVEGGLLKEFHVTCSKSKDCSGFNCTGVAYGNDIVSGIQLYACEDPPSIEFQVNVPKLDVHNFKKRIYHNDSISLTKNLKVEFEMDRENKELILGMYVHFLNNGSFPLLHMRLPVISHIRFPVDCSASDDITRQPENEYHSKAITRQPVTVSNGISVVSSPTASALVAVKGPEKGYSNCSIVNSTCDEEEMCKQIHRLKPEGICVCISNYTRDINGKCIYGQPKEASSVSLLLTAILVPIFVIIVIVATVYASIRFRVCQHLRRRLRVQVYEHVLLGEEDEEDLTNPVA